MRPRSADHGRDLARSRDRALLASESPKTGKRFWIGVAAPVPPTYPPMLWANRGLSAPKHGGRFGLPRDRRSARVFLLSLAGFTLAAALCGLATNLGALEFFVDEGQDENWLASYMIVLAALVAVAALVTLAFWKWRRDSPVVEVRLLRNLGFAIANVLIFFTGVCVVTTTQVLPQFAQQLLGYTATDAGLALTAAPSGCGPKSRHPALQRLALE